MFRVGAMKNSKSPCSFPHICNGHIELVYFLEGEVTAYADSAEYLLQPGDIFVVFPNQVHRYVTRTAERFFILIVNPALIPELAHVFISSLPVSSLLRGEENLKLFALFQAIHQESSCFGTYQDAILKGYLLGIFGAIATADDPRSAAYQSDSCGEDDLGLLRTQL